ncbi:MFS transporter [Nonomuraea sp. NPDC046570]|uniref:MFS transporter n=1 Tax=Nonomuraea sp. NPDC046570 TaxID=3155255 RepID=UPI0033E5064D
MTSVAEPIRLIRDRPTLLIYLQLATFSTYIYGLSAALPLLRQDLGVPNAVAGLHGTAMAAGTILAGIALPMLTRRFGRRAVTWIGLAGVNAGMALVITGTALPATLLGYGVAGLFGSVMLYAAMAALSDHHGRAGPASINEANAVAVASGVVCTFVISAAAQSVLGWRAALLITPVASALLAATMGRVWIPWREPLPGGAPDRARVPVTWRFHLAGAVLCCCVALEFCFILWAAEVFATRTGLSAAQAATGLTAFLAGVTAGRFGGTWLALRLPPTTLLVGALALTGAGWLVFWQSTQPALSYAGLAISGLGVALHFPMALAGLIDRAGDRPDRASAAAPVWAGVAMGSGPFVLGALADGFGTHTAFLLVPVIIAFAVAGALTARPRS